MTGRLIFTIVTTLLEEVALAVVMLWALPAIGFRVPLPGTVVLMALWLAYSVITYQAGSRSLARKQLVGLPGMVGSEGEAVSPLAPEGMVRIKGELWAARGADGEIGVGSKVIVVGQERLKLTVRVISNGEN